jgi:hypothetical protein
MRPATRFSGASTLLLAHIVVVTTWAQNSLADDATEAFQKQAAEYEFKDADSGNVLTLHAQPLLHWGNPARNGEDGAVFIWTSERHPALIGTCFTYVYRDRVQRKHAFQVLADAAIEGRHRNRVIWTPPENSLSYQPVPKAPAPAASPSGRNVQLRMMARRFQVKLTQKDGRQEQCRLVPKPLYRYEGDKSAQVSGAIFSLAIGTDPEALLILDQRENKRGKPAWHYALARFTFYPLEGFLDDESVWKLEQSESLTTSILTRRDYQREPYITFKPDWLD